MEFEVDNPLVETVVHSAPKVGKASESLLAIKLALKFQDFGRKRRSKSYTLNCVLPPELWLVIFDIVLAPIRRTHELTSSDTVLTTIRTTMRFGTHVLKYDDWPRLRLVCRMFHDLLGPNRYQGIQGLKDDRKLSIGVEILSIVFEDEPIASFVALQDLSALSKIRLFDITLVVKTSYGGSIQDIMDHLYGIAPNLPLLRSLTVCCLEDQRPHRLRDDTWQQIAHSFPLLEDLCLWRNEPIKPCKPAVLKNIKTLRVVEMPSTDAVHFPSLVHAYSFRWNSDGTSEMLHARQLLSLCASHFRVGLSQGILQLSPSLRVLGAPISSLVELKVPPPDHPINHLGLEVEHGSPVRTTLEQKMPLLLLKLKQIPGITKIAFRRKNGLPPADMQYLLGVLQGTNVRSIFAES